MESVLHYGLPAVDFTTKYLVDAIDAAISTSTEEKIADDDEGEEYHDFVLLRFESQNAGYTVRKMYLLRFLNSILFT